jgi:ubiquitin carboxyl-terminal hydrolase 4/11/15
VIDPYYLKFEISKFAPQFGGYTQEDSHELFTYMLDAIHEDLNRCQNRPIVDAVTGDSTNDEPTAALAWENHRKRNDSVIVDLFHGQLRSKLICPECRRATAVFDPYVAVPLPIQCVARPRELPVVFVPFDMSDPPRGMLLPLAGSPSQGDVSSAVSSKLGRDVRAVIGSRLSTGEVTWHVTLPDDDDRYGSTRYSEYWVFEIGRESALWVPCVLRMGKRNGRWTDDSTLLGPFMVPVRGHAPRKDDLVAAARVRLAWLWRAPPTDAEKAAAGKAADSDDTDSDDTDSDTDSDDTPQSDAGLPPEALALKRTLELPHGPVPAQGPLVVQTYSTLTASFTNAELSSQTAKMWLSGPPSGFDINELVVRAVAAEAAKPPAAAAAREGAQVDLRDCFAFFSEPAVLDEQNQWFCPHCRKHVCAEKAMDIWSVPRILVIQLKRFVTTGYYPRKLDRPVSYPITLDMAPFVRGPQSRGPCNYRLFAVSEHSGMLGGGHYTAHAVVLGSDGRRTWFDFNDSSAWDADEASAVNGLAYLLFYEREDGIPVSPLPIAAQAPPAVVQSDDEYEEEPPTRANVRGNRASSSGDDDGKAEIISFADPETGAIRQRLTTSSSDDDTENDEFNNPLSSLSDDEVLPGERTGTGGGTVAGEQRSARSTDDEDGENVAGANDGSEKLIADDEFEKTGANDESEKVTADDGSEKATADDGSEKDTADDGTEKATGEVGTDEYAADDGSGKQTVDDEIPETTV